VHNRDDKNKLTVRLFSEPTFSNACFRAAFRLRTTLRAARARLTLGLLERAGRRTTREQRCRAAP
jgi:hypothetical protein